MSPRDVSGGTLSPSPAPSVSIDPIKTMVVWYTDHWKSNAQLR